MDAKLVVGTALALGAGYVGYKLLVEKDEKKKPGLLPGKGRCGESYAYKIRTAQGATITDLCPTLGPLDYCNKEDWKMWMAAADAFLGELLRKASDLRNKARARGRPDVFLRIQQAYIVPAQHAVETIRAKEPGWYQLPTEEISAIAEAMNSVACALEQVDLGYAEIQLRAPETPGAIGETVEKARPTDWPKLLQQAGIAVGLGTLGYLFARYYLQRRLLMARPTARAGMVSQGWPRALPEKTGAS